MSFRSQISDLFLNENQQKNERNRAAKPVDLVHFGCNCGAIGMERMDSVLLMDSSWLTPSRGWTDITPMEAMFSPPVQFEVRRSIH